MAGTDPLTALQTWEREFLRKAGYDQTTQKAWRKIEQAGIADDAKILLFRYATIQSEAVERTKSVGKLADAVKVAARAQLTKHKREKKERMAATPWLRSPNPQKKTFGDAKAAYPILGKIPDQRVASVFTKAGGVRHEADPGLFCLLLLQKCACEVNVELGYSRIQALAACASTDKVPDVRTLHGFFTNQDMLSAADEVCASVSRYNPPKR
jgi:hypothetical protein